MTEPCQHLNINQFTMGRKLICFTACATDVITVVWKIHLMANHILVAQCLKLTLTLSPSGCVYVHAINNWTFVFFHRLSCIYLQSSFCTSTFAHGIKFDVLTRNAKTISHQTPSTRTNSNFLHQTPEIPIST